MTKSTLPVTDSASLEIVPPPRCRHDQSLQVNAVQAIRILGLLPLARSVVAFAFLSQRRLPAATRKRGHPLVVQKVARRRNLRDDLLPARDAVEWGQLAPPGGLTLRRLAARFEYGGGCPPRRYPGIATPAYLIWLLALVLLSLATHASVPLRPPRRRRAIIPVVIR